MGSMAPYFSVYPVPAKVPTNAAIAASQYMPWEVSVVDGDTPIAVRVEPFGSGALAIRPMHGWPPDRSLVVVARREGQEARHPFETASAPHVVPPTSDWKGPQPIEPKRSTPGDMWPTNIPRPPKNQRTFSMPRVYSTAGYMVAARLWVNDRKTTWTVEVGLGAATDASGPPPHVNLVPAHDPEFSDKAQVIGMQLTDLAGNVSRYGTTD